LNLYKDGSSIVVCFDVKNVGNVPGKEITQLYVRAPRVKIDKPYQELKGFFKTDTLAPGEMQKVKITVQISDLASFDGEKWVVEEGIYEFRVGASSRDIRLKGTLNL